jgi:DNA-binding MarR family transcriptional regulator
VRVSDLGWQLSTASVLFHEAIARRLGLTAVEHKALGAIVRGGPMPAGALAPQLGVGASAVTGIVDRLVRSGYVERRPDPVDRRRILIAATSATPDLSAIFADLGREMAAVTSRYDTGQLAAISDYVERTIEVLRAQTAKLRDTA